MKFYSIQHSLNKKILGNYPQVKEIIYHCDVDNEPLFIDKFYFEEINVKPIVANPVLYAKSKLTDLIYLWHTGFTFVKLISGKLKVILENNRDNSLQFIQCSVFKDGIEYKDYWLLNVFEFNHEYIDIENSKIYYEKHSDDFKISFKTDKILLNVNNLSEFMKHVEIAKVKTEIIGIENLKLINNINDDFFRLRYVFGQMYFVSEKLKKEIEYAGCTGIEFQPVELSPNEWMMPEGERKKIYGKIK